MSQHTTPYQPLQVPPRRKVWPYLLGALALVGLLALCAGIVAGTTGGTSGAGRPAQVVGTVAGTSAASTAGAVSSAAGGPASAFGAQHVKLTVKLTSKECFGSAGCLVQWSIRLATKTGASIPDRCEITYDVTGLKDGPQVGTLVLTQDGQYTQDEYASGQTPRSSTKLAAKVTDMECD